MTDPTAASCADAISHLTVETARHTRPIARVRDSEGTRRSTGTAIGRAAIGNRADRRAGRDQNRYVKLAPICRFAGNPKKNARSVVVDPATLFCAGFEFVY